MRGSGPSLRAWERLGWFHTHRNEEMVDLRELSAGGRQGKMPGITILLKGAAEVIQGTRQLLRVNIDLLKAQQAICHQVETARKRTEISAGDTGTRAEIAIGDLSLNAFEMTNALFQVHVMFGN